ncbi:unnamed protein product [Rotaria sp. Silwood2]|nr:unnamed protein product [Rotaria sp. Silwood2]
MVKHKSHKNAERYMMEYRMRTSYAIPTQINQFNSDKQNTRSPRLNAAHDRSHAKHSSTQAFYHSEGRIDKNKRAKKPTQQQQQQQQQIQPQTTNTNQGKVPITTKKSSCCTIL